MGGGAQKIYRGDCITGLMILSVSVLTFDCQDYHSEIVFILRTSFIAGNQPKSNAVFNML